MDRTKSVNQDSSKPDLINKLVAWGCKVFHLTKYQKILTQLAKFFIAGVATTLFDWAIFYVLVYLVQMAPLIAQIFSFTISTLLSYFINTIWVFNTTKNKTRRRLITEFFVFSGIAFAISEVLLYLFIYQLGLNDMLAKVITTIVTMVFNYITRKLFLEDHRSKAQTTK